MKTFCLTDVSQKKTSEPLQFGSLIAETDFSNADIEKITELMPGAGITLDGGNLIVERRS